MDVLLDSLYLVAVIASLIFFFGVVFASIFISSRFSNIVNFSFWLVALLNITSWWFESTISDGLSTWISVVSFMWFSAYFSGIFLFLTLAKKRLGKILFRIREYDRLLVISLLFLLVLGLLIFLLGVNGFNSASMAERIDLIVFPAFLLCMALFSTSILVHKLEIRENGVVFLDFRNLPNIAIVKKRNIDSLLLDSPRNILKMHYRKRKGEIKEAGIAIKESHVERIIAVLSDFYPNCFG